MRHQVGKRTALIPIPKLGRRPSATCVSVPTIKTAEGGTLESLARKQTAHLLPWGVPKNMARPPTSSTVELARSEETCLCSWPCCGKPLAHPDEIKRQKHTCTGGKKFACYECPKSFIKGGHLSKLARLTGLRREALGGGTLPPDNGASLEGCNNATAQPLFPPVWRPPVLKASPILPTVASVPPRWQ